MIKIKLILTLVIFSLFAFTLLNTPSIAQTNNDAEFVLDVKANTIILPYIFKPNIDLSGRGYYKQQSLPQTLASQEAIDMWRKDIGFSGIYRVQFNLWEIQELAKNEPEQKKLLENYDSIMRKISESGGIVILNIYGMPAGLGRALDKKSPFYDYRAFKSLIKSYIKNYSCDKRYNIWYEVWNAPDLDDFFLGRKQDYFNLYRAVAEAAKELEVETKIHIPVGGPATSWWFQNLDGNSIVTPEKSLIYELIKFCYSYRLPLNFISWHAYSTDAKSEKEITRYNKNSISLIRDWLSYFRFDRNTPLIIDEWNFDSGANILPSRAEKSYITSSYIVSRLKNMYEAGLDCQLFFSLEDFFNLKDNIIRNTGVFWHDLEQDKDRVGTKSIFNCFRMLSNLGRNMFFSTKFEDEFLNVIATKGKDYYSILIANYIDPQIALDYVSRSIARLNEAERKIILTNVKNGNFNKFINKQINISSMRLTARIKSLFNKAQEINERAQKALVTNRKLKLTLNNLKGTFVLERYIIDDTCSLSCEFKPAEQKDIEIKDSLSEEISLKPYSVELFILRNKPQEVIISAAPLVKEDVKKEEIDKDQVQDKKQDAKKEEVK